MTQHYYMGFGDHHLKKIKQITSTNIIFRNILIRIMLLFCLEQVDPVKEKLKFQYLI